MGAEGVSAVHEGPGHAISGVVLVAAERTAVHVDKLAYELVDLFAVQVGRVFGLFEEVGGGVLQLFHII